MKNIFLLAFFVFGLFFAIGTQRASAAACLSAGGTCWETNNCGSSTFGGKDLISVPIGDAACSEVYEAPVKCCKVGTIASSKPAAKSEGDDNGSTSFVNPLKFTTVEAFLGGIMTAIQRIVVVLALVFITIGAVMILTSAGSSGMVEQGKKAITAAMVGLALAIAAPSLLKELANLVGWGGDESLAGALTLTQIALNVLNFLLGTMGILALVMLVIGAILYLTSAGDEDRVNKGKDIFKFSLLGLVLAMASMILVTQIAKFFISPGAGAPVVPGNTQSAISDCGGKATGDACTGGTDSITWAGTCSAAGACQAVTARVEMKTTPSLLTGPYTKNELTACEDAGFSDEVCAEVDPNPNKAGQYLMPIGMVCEWRNVCPNSPMMACCK